MCVVCAPADRILHVHCAKNAFLFTTNDVREVMARKPGGMPVRSSRWITVGEARERLGSTTTLPDLLERHRQIIWSRQARPGEQRLIRSRRRQRLDAFLGARRLQVDGPVDEADSYVLSGRPAMKVVAAAAFRAWLRQNWALFLAGTRPSDAACLRFLSLPMAKFVATINQDRPGPPVLVGIGATAHLYPRVFEEEVAVMVQSLPFVADDVDAVVRAAGLDSDPAAVALEFIGAVIKGADLDGRMARRFQSVLQRPLQERTRLMAQFSATQVVWERACANSRDPSSLIAAIDKELESAAAWSLETRTAVMDALFTVTTDAASCPPVYIQAYLIEFIKAMQLDILALVASNQTIQHMYSLRELSIAMTKLMARDTLPCHVREKITTMSSVIQNYCVRRPTARPARCHRHAMHSQTNGF